MPRGERVDGLLPQLAERRRHRADRLSGGEQQMLAVTRALLLNPRLLLLDEPSDGPLVEQDLRTAFAVADEIAVLAKGEIVHRSPTREFRRNAPLASRLLGV